MTHRAEEKERKGNQRVMGEEPLYTAVWKSPASCGTIGACVGIWLWLLHRNLDYDAVGVSYRTLWRGRQFWRAFTASVSHIDLLHLVFNMSSLWSLRFLETAFGPVFYFRLSFLLLVCSIALMMLFYHVLIKYGGADQYQNVLGVGYSCVVFGLMTVAYQVSERSSLNLFGFAIPLSLMPFGSLLLTQLLVPRASFVGHLSGILLGYAYSWKLFAWFDTATFAAALFWSVVLFVHSLKTTTEVNVPFVRCVDLADLRAVRVEAGVINRERIPELDEDHGGGPQ